MPRLSQGRTNGTTAVESKDNPLTLRDTENQREERQEAALGLGF